MKNIKNSYQKRIKNLYKEIETAPETYEEVKVLEGNSLKTPEGGPLTIPKRFIGPFDLTKDNYDDELYDFIIGQGSASDRLIINARNDNKDVQRINYYHFNDKVENVNTKIIPNIMDGFDFTKEDAIKIAKPFVDTIDSTLYLVDVGDAVTTDYLKDDFPSYPFGYTLYYAKNYDGIETNFAEAFTLNEEIEYWNQKLYPQEYLTITVGKEGIVNLMYTSPMEINKKLASSVVLLPFEKIKEKFDSQIVLNTIDPDSKIYLKINRVELSMMRIAKPDSNEYLVIPVWDFYGGSIRSSDRSNNTDEEYWNEITEFYGSSYLTINAIDGAVIDRKLGY
jgi:hypothetical protein